MRVSRKLDAVGKSLEIRIDDNDQTLSLTLSGGYVGQVQVVGIISSEGQEQQLTAFNYEGNQIDINSVLPIDAFFDVGAFRLVKISVVDLTSGVVSLSANTTSAKRIKASGGGAGESEVEVTNFPANQNVTVTNFPSIQQTREIGYDSDGALLPSDFFYAPSSFTYDGDLMETEYRVIGPDTYTKTFTYDAEDRVISISGWVKTP